MVDYATAKLTPVDPAELAGKTIKEVDASSSNVLLIEFTDGTSVAIESHHNFHGMDHYEIMEMTDAVPDNGGSQSRLQKMESGRRKRARSG